LNLIVFCSSEFAASTFNLAKQVFERQHRQAKVRRKSDAVLVDGGNLRTGSLSLLIRALDG
jgi:hypothetical protein